MSNELTSDVPIQRPAHDHEGKIKLMEDNLQPDAIGFLIGEDGYPLVIRDRDSIFFGRFDKVSNTDSLQVDLTDYDAEKAGVSRRHAEVTKIGDAYHVTDVGSTNGTFLNDKRLSSFVNHALASKDTLRLGNLQITVVLPNSKPQQISQDLFFSHPDIDNSTFDFYRSRVVKLLDFLEMLDKKIAAVEQSAAGDIEMNGLTVEKEQLTLSISGGRKSLEFIKYILDPFQNMHASALTKDEDGNVMIDVEEMRKFVLSRSIHQKIPALPMDEMFAIAQLYYTLGFNLSTSSLTT